MDNLMDSVDAAHEVAHTSPTAGVGIAFRLASFHPDAWRRRRIFKIKKPGKTRLVVKAMEGAI